MSRKERKDLDIAAAPHLVKYFINGLFKYYQVDPSTGIRELVRRVVVAGNGEGVWRVDGNTWAVNFCKGGKAHTFLEADGLAVPLCQAYLDGEIVKGELYAEM